MLGESNLQSDPEIAAGKLEDCFRRQLHAIVAYSGGVDSALLAYAAHRALGDDMVAVLADSPSLARREYRFAIGFAQTHGIPLQIIIGPKNLETGQVAITSQNHGFAVVESSLPDDAQTTHRSLFDGTLQGFALKNRAAFGFQGHPEASPGPHDLQPLFEHFIDDMDEFKRGFMKSAIST